MSQGIKDVMIANLMYNGADVGIIIENVKVLSLHEFVNFYKAKHRIWDVVIVAHKATKESYNSPMPSFGSTMAFHKLTPPFKYTLLTKY